MADRGCGPGEREKIGGLEMITVSVVLIIGCIVADHLFPRIRPVEKFIRSLPLGRSGK